MKAYKIMRKKNYVQGAKVFTADAQYGNRIRKSPAALALATAAIEVCSQTEISFGVMCDMLECIQAGGRVRLPLGVELHHARPLVSLAQSAPAIQGSDFGAVFWEALYEKVRREARPSCPSRMDSYFAFRDLEALGRYRKKHWQDKMADKVICDITLVDCSVAFEADMVVLDDINENMTYSSAFPQVVRYFDQEFTPEPIVETLLQGCVELGSEVRA